MNTDYIRSLLIMFNNRSEYEIETALAIYEYMDKETIDYTEKNIEEINKMATLMTTEEMKAFVEDDYSYLFAPLF